MALEFHVPLKRSEIPNRDQWQAAIESSKYPLVLAEDFSPTASSGFVEAKYLGAERSYNSGFELDLFGKDGIEDELAQLAPEADELVSFRVGSDTVGYICCAYAAAALVKASNSVCWVGSAIEVADLVAAAAEAERGFENDDYFSLSAEKYSKRPPRRVQTHRPGWIECPGCNRRFSLRNHHVWDGEQHLSCGQSIIPTGDLEELIEPKVNPRKAWWKFWERE